MKLNHLLLAAALLFPAAASAAADTPAPQPAAQEGGYAPVQRFEFTDDDIKGGVLGPEGEVLESVRATKHPSLIEIREHFVPEMLKSLEDV